MRDVISEFDSEIEGSLAFWDVVFVCVENDVCEDGVCSGYVWWWLNVRESSLGLCRELCRMLSYSS